MSAMVERVAKAMASQEDDGILWRFAGSATHRLWMGRARHAIAAMRAPTYEMLKAADALRGNTRYDVSMDILNFWIAMIDEALK